MCSSKPLPSRVEIIQRLTDETTGLYAGMKGIERSGDK